MKTGHTIQPLGSRQLLLGVLVATCAFATAAYAQPSFLGKFTLAYEVHWSQSVLPPGVYYIRMDSDSGRAVVSSARGNWTMYTNIPTIADSKQPGAFLTITRTGNERRVRSLNLPEIGKSVIFAPLTQSEKEELAKAGPSNTVPVVTARK